MSAFPNLSGSDLGTSDQVFLGLSGVYVDRGSHIAHFFRGEGERLTVLVPYIQAGLEAGDQCLLVTEAGQVPAIKDRLRELGVDAEAALASGRFLVFDGGSEVEQMSSMFDAVISSTKNAGREVIRIGGDMTWALDKMSTADKLLEWEIFLDSYLGPRSSFVALCQYDQTRFSGSGIMCALQTHSLSIIGGIVQENPFHRDPDEVLQELSHKETKEYGSALAIS